MLRVFEIYHKPTGFRDDDRAFVAANTAKEAIKLAKNHSDKAQDWEYINIRAKRIPMLDYMLITEKPDEWGDLEWEMELTQYPRSDEPRWLFDNETGQDMLDQERRWFDSQCLG